jgi:MFS family permease
MGFRAPLHNAKRGLEHVGDQAAAGQDYGKVNRYQFILALCVGLLDGVALGVILPLLPFLLLHFGGRPAIITQLVALYGLAGFIANPIMGRLSDRIGRTELVLVSLVGTLVSYVGILTSWSLAGVFAFRLLGGLLSGRGSVLRALVTDGASAETQISRIGWLSAIGAIGAAGGPVLGGLVGLLVVAPVRQFQIILSIGIATTIIAMLAFAVMRYAKPVPEKKTEAPAPQPKIETRKLLWLLRMPLIQTVVTSYVYGIMFSVTALLVHARFGWGVAETGWLVGSLAAAVALVRAFLLPVLNKIYGLSMSLAACLLVSAATLLVIGLTKIVWLFVPAFILCSCAIGLANILPTTMVSLLAPKSARGYTMGIAQAFGTFATAISASLNGFWFDYVGPSAPYLVGVAVLVLGAALLGYERLVRPAAANSVA